MEISVLGATGSVGLSTAEVLAAHPDRFVVDGLAAGSDWQSMHRLCLRLKPRRVAMESAEAGEKLRALLLESAPIPAPELDMGPGAAERLAADGDATLVCAITGVAGLASLRAGVKRGATLLLANKEALVVGGRLLLDEARATGSRILPLDSEHNAIFQCLDGKFEPGVPPEGVSALTLTASGGPFLRTPPSELRQVTPEQAMRHPTWDMGAKISVDSATLMNKGLELIEASVLFGLPAEQLQVLIHPQSLVHALVTFVDGSVLAHMASPDMKVPIAHALAWPNRLRTQVQPPDLAQLPDLHFEQPDLKQFPCLALALDALAAGGSAPVVLNAANEEAVQAFLAGRIGFADIAATVEQVLQNISPTDCDNVQQVIDLDCEVRRFCASLPGGAIGMEKQA